MPHNESRQATVHWDEINKVRSYSDPEKASEVIWKYQNTGKQYDKTVWKQVMSESIYSTTKGSAEEQMHNTAHSLYHIGRALYDNIERCQGQQAPGIKVDGLKKDLGTVVELLSGLDNIPSGFNLISGQE